MESELARGLEEKWGNQLEGLWGIQVKDNLEGSSCEPSQLDPSVCPAAHSFPHTTPASLAAFLFPESLVIVLSTPGPRLLFPAPAPPSCISPHLSRQSCLMGQPQSHSVHIPAASTFLLHPHSFTPLRQAPWKGRKSLVTTQTTEDSVASVQDRPRQLGSPLSTGTEPGGVGSFLRLTPGSR